MLPNAMHHVLLLLLCTLASADDTTTPPLAPCDKSLIKGPQPTDFTLDGTPLKLKCTGDKLLVFNKQRYNEITCDPDHGWKGADVELAESTDTLSVECVVVPDHICVVQPIAGTKLDGTTNILTCEGQDDKPPLQILTKKERYKSLKCDGINKKWTTVAGAPEDVAGANTVLPMTCVPEYCDVIGEGLAESMWVAKVRTITCKDPFQTLAHSKNLLAGGKALCTKDGGWKDEKGNVVAVDAKKVLEVECVEACKNQDVPAKNIKVTIDPTDASTKVFKCEKSDSKPYAIEVDGRYVYQSLKCSKDKGWMDQAGNKLGHKTYDAYAEFPIICAEIKCVNNNTCGKIPEGYNCNPINRPEIDTLDCPEKQKLFDITDQKFYDLEIVCRNAFRSDDKSWLTFDKTEDVSVREKSYVGSRNGHHAQIICLEKRCTKCDPLPSIAGAVASAYAAGTTVECANAKCTNDLWSVRRTKGGAVEQYAGPVNCSSEKATERKWLIDGMIPIVEGSCITEVSSCITAAKLDTACDPKWGKKIGCVPVTLSDTTAVACPKGKIMFYKPLGSQVFPYTAMNITCDKKEGQWIATRKGLSKDGLKRGGTVICADSNPAPPPLKLPDQPKSDKEAVKLALIICGSIGGVAIFAIAGFAIYKPPSPVGQFVLREGVDVTTSFRMSSASPLVSQSVNVSRFD